MQTSDFIMMESMLIVISMISVLYLENGKKNRKTFLRCLILGCIMGALVGVLSTAVWDMGIIAAYTLLGILSSTIVQLFFLATKIAWKNTRNIEYYDDGTPPHFYITGDKHRDFNIVKSFCRDMKTRKKDVLIILGDAGFNYYGDKRDDKLKADISALNITLFCLHGNKENRPQNIGTYGIRTFCGGKVYYEPAYPNIYFAMDGEVYTFEGRKYLAVGGAHSVDKLRCLEKNLPFFEDEMPNDEIKKIVKKRLDENNNIIFGMLTHTCPLQYLPTEMFVSTRQNAQIKRRPTKSKSKKFFKPDIDRSTEEWLDSLEKNLITVSGFADITILTRKLIKFT